jgi:hypothetical protein
MRLGFQDSAREPAVLTGFVDYLIYFRQLPQKLPWPLLLTPFTSYYSRFPYTVELGCNVTKRTEYFVSLKPSVVITEQYNVVVKSDELFGSTECLTYKSTSL